MRTVLPAATVVVDAVVVKAVVADLAVEAAAAAADAEAEAEAAASFGPLGSKYIPSTSALIRVTSCALVLA
jgi:hypothetical protein